jgi:glycosyltransferase involved in cell wall biosynthesis
MNSHEQPLVSVILCFYNEQRFIKEAIESVRNQTYSHWELLMVDDGSSDLSPLIAKSYVSQYPKNTFYLQHEGHLNKGLSASRNVGIKKAKGKYVAFIDADDIWLPEKLENQVALLESNTQASVLLEASYYWKSWTETSETDVTIPIGARQGIYDPPLLAQLLYPLGKGAAPCPSGMMVRREVLDRYTFEESFRGLYQMYEDQAFLCKIYLNETVVCIKCMKTRLSFVKSTSMKQYL